MDETLRNSLIIGGLPIIGGLITELIRYLKRIKDRNTSLPAPTSLEESILFRFPLSKACRRKIGRSQFISDGETETALAKLMDLAKKSDTILAMCGTKGNYSKKYYARNFDECGSVKRVFSFEAIKDEFRTKGERYALEGLQQHVAWKPRENQVKELFFVPEGNLIRNITDNTFNPPLSFGFAILLEGVNPKKAVLHWETGNGILTDIMNIEGFVVDGGQQKLLKELVLLHGKISGSDPVLSLKDNEVELLDAIAKLEKEWKVFIRTDEYKDIKARAKT